MEKPVNNPRRLPLVYSGAWRIVVNGAKPTEETTGMPQILRAFGFTGEVTVKMAGQTHGQAHKDLRTVIGLAATWAFMQIPRTPEGATKWGHVNAALVVALRSFGSPL